MGHAVAHGGWTVLAVALPCGMAVLLTPFLGVPWRDMVTLQEPSLEWVCTWHTHPAGMDPHRWQARAVVTYMSWSLPTARVPWTQWWDRALSWARDGSDVAACPDLPRESIIAQPWTVSILHSHPHVVSLSPKHRMQERRNAGVSAAVWEGVGSAIIPDPTTGSPHPQSAQSMVRGTQGVPIPATAEAGPEGLRCIRRCVGGAGNPIPHGTPTGRPYPPNSAGKTRGSRLSPPLCGEELKVQSFPTPHGASLSTERPRQDRRDSGVSAAV